MSRKPTLQDVADAAGVSTATVSRFLNQPDKVSPVVQAKISQTIDKLGYVPHGAARALASRRTHTIGAVVPTIDNAIFSEAIQYLQRGLTQAGYTLLLANSNYSPQEELREIQALLTRGIDGLVLVGEEHLPEVYQAIQQHKLPHVNLWSYRADSEFSCIGLDNLAAGRELGRHLFELGHQRIGAVTAILENNDRASQRLAGVRHFLAEQGVEIPDSQVVQCRYSGEQGRLAVHKLFERHGDLTAVICGNDILALGALSAARELDLTVPDDLSVTGFDNLEMLGVLHPALTTVHVPSRRMGTAASEYLLECIASGDSRIERIELEARLIVRETTGLAPSTLYP